MKTLLMLAALIIPLQAQADCHRAYICEDGNENCRYEDLCESALDLPSNELNPLPALRTIDLKPLDEPTLAPLGTKHCAYKIVNGTWQQVCR